MRVLCITGYWNSGTTLLVDILRHHPELILKKAVHLPNLEERATRKILRVIFASQGKKHTTELDWYMDPDLSSDDQKKFRDKFLKLFHVPSDKTLLIKNPWYQFCPSLIRQTLDGLDVHFIHIFRDARSQVVSKDYWKRDTKTEQERKEKLLERARFWVKNTEKFYREWRSDPRMLVLRYENLCSDVHGTLEKICAHCKMDKELIPEKFIPSGLQVRMKNWNNLDPEYRNQVQEIIGEMQGRLDRDYPAGGSF